MTLSRCLAFPILALALAMHPLPAAAGPAAAPAATPADAWQISQDGKTYGPYDVATIADMLVRGSINESATTVWRDGMAEWQPVSAALPQFDLWYARVGTRVIGPVSRAEILQATEPARTGQQPASSVEVRLADATLWVPLTEAKLLAPATAPAPAAVAPATAPATADAERPVAESKPKGEPGEKEALLEKSRRMRLGGLVTMLVGTSLVVIGGGIAGGYSTGAVGTKGLWAGVGIFSVGLVPTFVGLGVFLGSKRPARKAAELANARVLPSGWASRSGGGIGITGRF